MFNLMEKEGGDFDIRPYGRCAAEMVLNFFRPKLLVSGYGWLSKNLQMVHILSIFNLLMGYCSIILPGKGWFSSFMGSISAWHQVLILFNVQYSGFLQGFFGGAIVRQISFVTLIFMLFWIKIL